MMNQILVLDSVTSQLRDLGRVYPPHLSQANSSHEGEKVASSSSKLSQCSGERDYLPKVPAKIAGGLLGALPWVSFPELVTVVRRRAFDNWSSVPETLRKLGL